MNYQAIIDQIVPPLLALPTKGEVADYIPELAKVPGEKFGVHVCSLDGNEHHWGDSQEKFSIQSISKVLSLTLAFELVGTEIWKRVGVEPSGNPFNSLVQLEYENGKPRNPLINSGALVICDMLVSALNNPYDDYLNFIRKLVGRSNIDYSHRIAQSEKDTGFRNTALINLMKSFGNIENDVESVLGFYYLTCSVEMTCQELAKAFLIFANGGKLSSTGEAIINVSKSKRINAIMMACGFYDEAGEFAFQVGLPGKSGVGGGIVAVHPGQYSVAVWSPRLNKKGNSHLGMKFLEQLTTDTGLSIF